MERNGRLTDEQKGCRKESRRSKNQLLVYKAIVTNCRGMLTNLSLVWIDYKRAHDMVRHSWILKCLEMVGAAKNMISIISDSMAYWKTVLTSGRTAFLEVDIRKGIFQDGSSSPLLFTVIILPLTSVLRKMRAGYRLAENMKPINHLLFMDDMKLYGVNRDQQGSRCRLG